MILNHKHNHNNLKLLKYHNLLIKPLIKVMVKHTIKTTIKVIITKAIIIKVITIKALIRFHTIIIWMKFLIKALLLAKVPLSIKFTANKVLKFLLKDFQLRLLHLCPFLKSLTLNHLNFLLSSQKLLRSQVLNLKPSELTALQRLDQVHHLQRLQEPKNKQKEKLKCRLLRKKGNLLNNFKSKPQDWENKEKELLTKEDKNKKERLQSAKPNLETMWITLMTRTERSLNFKIKSTKWHIRLPMLRTKLKDIRFKLNLLRTIISPN